MSSGRLRDDQQFNIEFLQLISKHKALYDPDLPEYRNKEKLKKIWKLVATEVNGSGEENIIFFI